MTPNTYLKYIQNFTISSALLLFVACSKDDTPLTQENNTESISAMETTQEVISIEDKNTSSTQDVNKSDDETIVDTEEKLPWMHGTLKVSDNKHFLQHEDGTGFFWMADTAWHLSRKLTSSDIDIYLKARKESGFSVILFSAAELTGIRNHKIQENAFSPQDWKHPNEKYWKNVDYIVNKAEEIGLYVGILPAWDQTDLKQGLLDVGDAKHYGNFIAKRYKNKPNIIWVIGGDTDNANIEKDDVNVSKKLAWEALGTAIKKVVNDKHLITFHTRGVASSRDRFEKGEATWLDFHMIQSGHCNKMARGVEVIIADYEKGDKPTVDAESRYEDIVECFYLPLEDRPRGIHRFDDKDVREIAYRQIFSGAFGHTYGHQSIWHMSPKADPEHELALYSTTLGWKDALNTVGATQMGYISKLMKSRDMLSRIPDTSMVESNSIEDLDEENAVATRGDGYALIYLPKGGEATVKLDIISGDTLNARWFNPRTGKTTKIETIGNSGKKVFDTEDTEDMILILDDTSKKYKNP